MLEVGGPEHSPAERGGRDSSRAQERTLARLTPYSPTAAVETNQPGGVGIALSLHSTFCRSTVEANQPGGVGIALQTRAFLLLPARLPSFLGLLSSSLIHPSQPTGTLSAPSPNPSPILFRMTS